MSQRLCFICLRWGHTARMFNSQCAKSQGRNHQAMCEQRPFRVENREPNCHSSRENVARLNSKIIGRRIPVEGIGPATVLTQASGGKH